MASTNKQVAKGNNIEQSIQNIVVDSKYFDKLIASKYPSVIHQVVVALFDGITSQLPPTNGVPVYSPDDKISHNGIVLYKEIIYAYGEYTQFLEKAYESLDNDTPGRKNRFLFFIHTEYLKIIGELQKDKKNQGKTKIEIIRENSDDIISEVISVLMLHIAAGHQNIPNLSKEDLTLCVTTIVCHAFVECKVLENPSNK